MIRRLAMAFLVAMAALVVLAAPASAHASLQATSPEASALLETSPEAVELRFTEPVEAGLGGIRVLDPAGQRADRGDPAEDEGGAVLRVPVDAEAEGTYTVAWSVTSDDGHLIAGSFLFSVGRESTPAEVSDAGRPAVRFVGAVGRFLAFAGTMGLTGIVAFVLLVRRRQATARLRTLALTAAVVVLLGSSLALVVHVALSSGRPLLASLSLLGDSVRSTRFGQLGIARAGLALSSLGLAIAWRRDPRMLPVALLGVVTLGLVSLPAFAGHAWTTSPLSLAVGTDVVHLLAVGVWTGGLAALLVHARDDDAVALARRFSNVALAAVVVVAATGSISSYLQVRGFDGLETSYGRLLIIKIVLVLLLIGIASLTRSLLRQDQHATVFRSVMAEIAVVVLVLGITSVLVNRPPARSAVAQPFNGTVVMEGGGIASVQVQVQPARAGANDIHLYFIGSNGLPQPVDAVEMTVAQVDIPARRVEITPVTPDHVSAYGATLPSAGLWTLTITAVRSGETSTAELELEIR